jgi:hypothetical protein
MASSPLRLLGSLQGLAWRLPRLGGGDLGAWRLGLPIGNVKLIVGKLFFPWGNFYGKMTSRLKPRRVTNEDRCPWLLTRSQPPVWHHRPTRNQDKPRRALNFFLASASAWVTVRFACTLIAISHPAAGTASILPRVIRIVLVLASGQNRRRPPASIPRAIPASRRAAAWRFPPTPPTLLCSAMMTARRSRPTCFRSCGVEQYPRRLFIHCAISTRACCSAPGETLWR